MKRFLAALMVVLCSVYPFIPSCLAQAFSVYSGKGEQIKSNEFIEAIKKNNVVYFLKSGLDEYSAPTIQQIIKALKTAANQKFSLAMDSFYNFQPTQEQLDLYIKGKISMEQLFKNTECWANEGFLKFAKERQLPLLGLGVPLIHHSLPSASGINKKIWEKIELTTDEKGLLPKNGFIYRRTGDEQYYKFLQPDSVGEKFIRCMYVADEIYAATILKFFETHSYETHTLMVLIGSPYAALNQGTVSSVRIRNETLKQTTVLILDEEEQKIFKLKNEYFNNFADYIICKETSI